MAVLIAAVESEGLLQQGREPMDYLMSRLLAVQTSCSEIESVARIEVSIRIAFAAPLLAKHVRSGMCERGVLVCVDEIGRLVIDPPLPVRIVEADVITGALRDAHRLDRGNVFSVMNPCQFFLSGRAGFYLHQ